MSPIIEAWGKVFPGIEMSRSQKRDAQRSDQPEVVAMNLAAQAQGYRDNFDRILGPGVVTEEDVAKCFIVWSTSTSIGHLSPATLFYPLGYERAVELGRLSGDYWRGLFIKHIGAVDQDGYDWWSENSEAWFVAAAKRDGTLK